MGIDGLDVGEEALAAVLLDPVARLAEDVLRLGALSLADVVGVVVPALVEAEAIGDVAVGDEVIIFGEENPIDDLAKHNCTIEEMEEYEPHIRSGITVFAGVDYEAIVREAEKIAEDLGVSEGTIRSRVKKLRDEGILEITGLINPDVLPDKYVVMVGVKLKDMNLVKKAEDITLYEIMTAIEGHVTLVDCVENSAVCKRNTDCGVRFFWKDYQEYIAVYLTEMTLQDFKDKYLSKEIKG